MSTRFSLPVSPITFKEKTSSSRENTVQSYMIAMGNLLDDDVARLETAIGLTSGQGETGINYSSNRVLVDGENPIAALGRLDAALAVDSNLVHTIPSTLAGTVSTAKGSLTFTVNTGTDVLTFSGAHGMSAGHPLRVATTGGLPGGLSASTTYYLGNITATEGTLHLSSAAAIAGTGVVNITTAGTGTHSINGLVVVGTGTSFTTVLAVNDYIYITDLTDKIYQVSNIESNTILTVTAEIDQTDASSTLRKLDDVQYPIILTSLPKLKSDPVTSEDPVRLGYVNTLLRRVISPKTANYTITTADLGVIIDCTNSITLAFDPAATLMTGFTCDIRNSGTGIVTLDPSGAELIDGLSSIRAYQKESFSVYTNGTGFTTIGRSRGLILIEEKTAATSTTIDFGNVFIDSEMKFYQCLPYDVIPATNDVGMRIRISDDAGATYKAGASDYVGYVSDGGTPANTGAVDSIYTHITTATTMISNAAGNGACFRVDIYNPAGTALEKMIRGEATWEDANSSSTRCWEFAGKYQAATAAVTGIRFFMSSGNITSGKFPMYGLRS